MIYEVEIQPKIRVQTSMDREIDPDTCAWIIEFLVRNSADEMLLKKLIQALPPLKIKPCLEKALLLRCIKNKFAAGEISEKMLDLLEMIERIDSSQRLKIPDSMREAYCAIALECTAKYLAGATHPYGQYSAAVNRIWRGRIENLEKSKASKLVSGQLRSCRRLVEAAFGDKDVARSLIVLGTRNNAALTLRLYLRDALALMGPPFLERAFGSVSGGV